MTFCAYCGKELPVSSSFCPSCGKPVAIGTTSVPASVTSTMIPSQSHDQTVARPSYASEFDRIIAVIVDSIIIFLFAAILLLPLRLFGFLFGPFSFFVLSSGLLVYFLFALLYFTYFETTTGQTIGKQFVHIRVVDEVTLRPLDFSRSFIRNIFRIIDWLPVLYLLGIIVIAVDRQKRRLGDTAARSIVIKA